MVSFKTRPATRPAHTRDQVCSAISEASASAQITLDKFPRILRSKCYWEVAN